MAIRGSNETFLLDDGFNEDEVQNKHKQFLHLG